MSLDDDLLKAIREEAAFIMGEGAQILRDYFGEVFREYFYRSVTVQSILDGELREELGLGTQSIRGGGVDPDEVMMEICEVAIKTAQILYQPDGDLGTLSVAFLDFEEILTIPGTTYESVNKRDVRTQIPWMRWLLFEGSNSLTGAAEVYTRGQSLQASRTGEHIMVNPKRGRIGQGYAISAPHAGTQEDNFLTRIAENALPEIEEWFQRELFTSAAMGGDY